MIQQLKDQHVSVIMLAGEAAVDGREDLKFRNTHPQLWQYIQNHYALQGPADEQGVTYWFNANPG
jgi:hypothetical protein